jgi:hypothetical protein
MRQVPTGWWNEFAAAREGPQGVAAGSPWPGKDLPLPPVGQRRGSTQLAREGDGLDHEVEIGGLAETARVDPGRHQRIGRGQRHDPAASGLHQAGSDTRSG